MPLLKGACQNCHDDYCLPWHWSDDRNWENGVVFCPAVSLLNVNNPMRMNAIKASPPSRCEYILEHTINVEES